MKRIESQEDKWQNSIVNDLGYIKKHLRYPWKSGMKTPLFMAAGFALLSVVLFLLAIIIARTGNDFILYFWPLNSLLLAAISSFYYLKSLKFTTIETGLEKEGNQQLIHSFLQEKQLLVYEHPQCPDIMQILSRPVNISSEQREVLVFIAAENEVLVNSHFTENSWAIMLKRRHGKTMVKSLEKYIADNATQQKTGVKKYW